MTHVNETEFRQAVAGQQLVVVDFFATWCGPCKIVAPAFADLAKKYPAVRFLKIDVDECGEIASQYGIRTIPTFVLFRGGKELKRVNGADMRAVEQLIAECGGASTAGGGQPVAFQDEGHVLGGGRGGATTAATPGQEVNDTGRRAAAAAAEARMKAAAHK